ncbi:C-C motif chemokine 19a.1 [Morone saxatilis]|uniref:C-C motif chemokine 19a.1 n=1 Tax=Morone saxatilis TaxID=34816 RepID=UPI0015E23E25|nr:C-C motif chemokine 19a.1 [Morone saxatilis]
MALWGDAKLFFCILFITCYCTVTLAQIPMDCCFQVKDKPIEKKLIVDYHQQISGQGCPINAMILVTRRDMKLCVPSGVQWVQDVKNHVDSLRIRCRKNNKARGCHKVRLE